MTKAELIQRYGIEWYEQYKARCKARYRNDLKYRESHKYQHKTHYYNDPEYRETVIAQATAYNKNNLNLNGKTKHNIRSQSQWFLFNKRNHSRLKEYEIHHCFGYDDATKFIYIPRELHRAIHALLRDNNIDADSNHYKYIVHMINECTEYTYISA